MSRLNSIIGFFFRTKFPFKALSKDDSKDKSKTYPQKKKNAVSNQSVRSRLHYSSTQSMKPKMNQPNAYPASYLARQRYPPKPALNKSLKTTYPQSYLERQRYQSPMNQDVPLAGYSFEKCTHTIFTSNAETSENPNKNTYYHRKPVIKQNNGEKKTSYPSIYLIRQKYPLSIDSERLTGNIPLICDA